MYANIFKKYISKLINWERKVNYKWYWLCFTQLQFTTWGWV